MIGMFVSIQTINSPAEEIKFGLPSIDTLANGPGTCVCTLGMTMEQQKRDMIN